MSAGRSSTSANSPAPSSSRVYADGQCPFVALPVFPSRTFRHSFIAVNRKFVKTAKDLEGKRIGLPMYTMTASIFIKGLLQHDCGVDLSKRHVGRGPDQRRPSSTAIRPPCRSCGRSRSSSNTTGRSLSDLLEAGEIHAVDRHRRCRTRSAATRTSCGCFPNFREAEKDYYKRTKIFPIMHLVVIRKRRLRAASVRRDRASTSALCAAKDHALGKMRYARRAALHAAVAAGRLDEIDQVFGGDPWPYGIEPNRPTLNALVQLSARSGR